MEETVKSQIEIYLENKLKFETSDEVKALKLKIMERIASENVIQPSSIPSPRNITEIGGYINLLREIESKENIMLKQLLASILSLPMKQ